MKETFENIPLDSVKCGFDKAIIMIKEVDVKDIAECVKVIRESFSTVANEFGFTVENAPKFTAFAATEERLSWHLAGEHRPMYAFFDNEIICRTYSIDKVLIFRRREIWICTFLTDLKQNLHMS